MSARVPIRRDPLDFEDRQQSVFSNMERDMDKRRKEWESEIERMRKDFFKMSPSGGGITKFDPAMPDGGEQVQTGVDDGKGSIITDEHGQPIFRASFDVHNFKPDEINVKTDNAKIVVHAKQQCQDGGSTVTREYNRELDIPRDVDAAMLQCSMTPDGVLMVEAPVPAPQYSAIKEAPSRYQPSPVSSGTSSTSRQSTTTTTKPVGAAHVQRVHGAPPASYGSPVGDLGAGFAPTPSSFSSSMLPKSTIVPVETGKQYSVEVDIEDFKPEELSVKTVDKKLIVSAKREEKIGTRSSTKEMSREIQIPENVDPTTVKAFFNESGKLLVEAPYLSGSTSATIRLT